MILYLDTSALVKLYIQEPGSKEVKELVAAARIVSTSRVSYVEARAGIARKFREGELTEEERRRIVRDLEEDWKNYFIVEVSESVAELGGELTDRYPLRGFDAIHLASALLLKNRTRSDVSFSCFDKRLREAAKAEGLDVPEHF
ncbi:type II toxin-antitoxin system VapC family toxin [Candidatus Bipolaricaulota sp. J31]